MFPNELVNKPVWRFFSELCRIPRTSGNEEAVSRYIAEFARERDLECMQDSHGNIMIRKPGRGEPVVLQAHMDMVGEKTADSTHDFLTDPVNAELDKGILIARETTLGADNGIGVAVMLELLHGEYPSLPALECLFTVDEERGLVGALTFPPEWITGTRLINLDSEDLGVITIGCAGGKDISLSLFEELEPWSGRAVEIRVSGLNGGHSGMEINAENANAVKLAVRLCTQVQELLGGRLASFSGGSKHNAIPREAVAVMALDEPSRASTLVSILKKDFVQEYAGIENGITVGCSEVSCNECLSEESSRRYTDLLMALPHGVAKMSGVVDGLVETSDNLAIVQWNSGRMEVLLSIRSAIESARNALLESIASAGRLAGAVVDAGEGYPGWTPDTSSELLKTASESCARVLGEEPAVEAIHAGLECGIIGERAGDLEMISMGPDIRNVHVPGEYVDVASVDSFMDVLTDILENL